MDGRSRLQAAKGPSGSVTLARSHPDVVGGEQDGAESPSRCGTPTGWATFAGIPQTTQKRGVGNGDRLGLSLFRGSRILQFRDKDPLKAMRIIKEVPLETRVP